jgi:hypothetical protein
MADPSVGGAADTTPERERSPRVPVSRYEPPAPGERPGHDGSPCVGTTRVVSPYLKNPQRSQAEAIRTMIAERERELARTIDPCRQAGLRREIMALKAQRSAARSIGDADISVFVQSRECLWCSRDIAMPCSSLSDPNLAALTEGNDPICRGQIDRHKPTTRTYKSIV